MSNARLLTAAAAVAATPLAVGAQDSVELDPITLEGQVSGGSLGETLAVEGSTATRTGAPIAETPRAISVETRQQMADKGARSLEDALLYTPGVRAGSYGVDKRGNWYDIRGFESFAFLDGLQMLASGYYNTALPEIYALERVEVLKGPASALYGAGSVGGLVNAVTKRPKAETERRAEIEYGSHDRKQAMLDLTGPLDEEGRWLGRFVGLARDSGTQVDHGRDDALLLAPSLTFRPDARTEITLLGRYQKNQASPDTQFLSTYGTLRPGPDGRYLDTDTFVGEPGFDRMDAEQYDVTLDASHDFEGPWELAGTLRWSRSNAVYNHVWWAYADYPTRYKPDGRIERTFFRRAGETEMWVGDLHAVGDLTTGPVEHELMIGSGYSHVTHDNDDGYGDGSDPSYWLDPFDPVYTGVPDIALNDTPAITFEQFGLYVQDRMRIHDRLLVTAGLRWDTLETDDPAAGGAASDSAFSENLGVMYRFPGGVSPYASYATSFRQEDFGTNAAGESFDPTKGEQYEIGVKYQPPGLPGRFGIAVFDLTKSNLLQQDPANPAFQAQTGEATSQGLELEGQTVIGEVELEANYAYLSTESADGRPLDTVPEHAASAFATWRPDGAWEGVKLGGGLRYVGETRSSDGAGGTIATDGQLLGDLMVGYETERWEATLTATNVTDESYVASAGISTGYYGPRRSVVLRLGAKF